ncbi:hypothetical protein A0H81_06075 [Grifola frondosa]|uniref:Choline/carnitine acyltransferase domain-containing protein n=1 Tax=Grifola frondosa TaxID=5627 RepID=A0A1C7MFW9_GRIFR|nr:hypothetical protein A0H81_06075 [Grifola frondosa]
MRLLRLTAVKTFLDLELSWLSDWWNEVAYMGCRDPVVVYRQGRARATAAELEAQIEKVIALVGDKKAASVGALTTDNHDTWTDACAALLAVSPSNTASLKAIKSAMIVLSSSLGTIADETVYQTPLSQLSPLTSVPSSITSQSSPPELQLPPVADDIPARSQSPESPTPASTHTRASLPLRSGLRLGEDTSILDRATELHEKLEEESPIIPEPSQSQTTAGPSRLPRPITRNYARQQQRRSQSTSSVNPDTPVSRPFQRASRPPVAPRPVPPATTQNIPPQPPIPQPPLVNPPAPNMATAMPARGHHTAPVFDPKEPRTLLRFFEDLEYLFTTLATAPTNELKKRHAVRYAPIDVADMWDQLPSYADATKTRTIAIGHFYGTDLGDYYREFFKITEFLRSRQRLSTSEIARTFYKPFHQLFGSLYTRDSSLNAAHYVLHGTRVDAPAQGTPAAATTSTALPPGTIKTEDFTSLIETVTRTIAQAFATSREKIDHSLGKRNLRTQKRQRAFDGVEIPRHLPARPPIPTAVNRVDNPPTHEPTEASQVTNPPSVSAPAPAASSTPSPATVPAPIHPYSQARDATYAPPQDRNLGVLPKPPKDKDAAYKTSAPVQDPRIARTSSIGVMVVPDPYETYLRGLKPGETPEVLTVAKESHALRSINGLVDNKEDVEGIIDPGSQIISMSEESANGEVDQSLGLVRNVPFQVSDIVLYLQIHVIRQAAYESY